MKDILDDNFKKSFKDCYLKIEENLTQGCIAALEFAASYKIGNNSYEVITLSKAHDSYFSILNNYIENHGSILFSDRTHKEIYSALNGDIKNGFTNLETGYYTFGVSHNDTNFTSWNNYLSDNQFGKYSFWLSLIDRSDKDWQFSIDMFLILNCDLSSVLPDPNIDFNSIKADELDKWKIRNSIFRVLYDFADDYGIGAITKAINREVEQQATKSVISDIINRNMAHHIISHVSNRATLDKVLERIDLKNDFLFKNETTFTSNEEKENNRRRNYETVLDLLNRFNLYRDERGEYLTYITNFSSPSSAYFFQDVILPFVENTLLMDNIAANENINYQKDTNGYLKSNKLQLKVKWNNNGKQENIIAEYFDLTGKKLYCSESLPYLRLKNDKQEYPYEPPKLSHQDIEISLPGTLGKHALYSILENFIRNSAKHGLEQKKNGLDIILLLNEKEEEVEATLTDNCSFVTEEKIIEFNESIQTEILKRKDLGLIDMKVNACILAGMELNDENCKKALIAYLYEGKLAYKFKIAKPKKAVFIGEFNCEKDNKNGFYYFKTIEEYRNSDISKSFEFAVLSDDLYENQKNTIASQLPARVLKYSEIESSKEEDIGHLYDVWLKILRGDKKANVHLFFEQNNNTVLTKEFKTKYEKHQNLKIYSNEDLNTELTITYDKNVFFDRHGNLIAKFSTNKSFVDTNHSWILIDKNNPDFDYISRYDIENKSNLLAYELEEAGLLKVLVIDERVAEQSVRTISDTDQASKLGEEKRSDFWKWEKQNGKFNLTLFDLAWASNVFLATHLGEVELKQKINEQTEHCLKVKFKNGEIELETNIPSQSASRINQKWNDNKTSNQISNSKNETICIKPDVIIIHRTKLKELLTLNSNFVKELLNKNEGISLVVTTGSGTTHGIEGDYKILPFATLSKFILGKRINKLQFSKTLLGLTKNKI